MVLILIGRLNMRDEENKTNWDNLLHAVVLGLIGMICLFGYLTFAPKPIMPSEKGAENEKNYIRE